VGAAALAGVTHEAVDSGRLQETTGSPLALLGFAAFVLVFGPIPEEIGWRGYALDALDALQARWSALSASVLLGVAWALWHTPLFFVAGYYADGSPPEPVLFTVAILVHSVVYTWIYNHTERSVLAMIAFHVMVNFVGMLMEGAPWVEWTRTGLTAAEALLAVGIRGARTLGPGPFPDPRTGGGEIPIRATGVRTREPLSVCGRPESRRPGRRS
jgi:uncharacterized protein